ncbi:LppP/LprE family lipoprotein [Tomitella gaofuii]|uniref:LppP/LprE family lipoprotein n=1 Tax=Tomitella gaofuii TaxID=2760083 RepID=UPI001F1FF827|nr:LppP/LprE family lipoprotein [Tomitella gaofuii]
MFGDGQIVADPAPILARHIDSVDRIDGSTFRVNYAFYDGPAAANRTTSGSATFHWDGSRVIVTGNTLPLKQNDVAEPLDIDNFR